MMSESFYIEQADSCERAAEAAPLEPVRRFKRQLLCKAAPEDLAKLALRLADAVTAHDCREQEIKDEAKAAREASSAPPSLSMRSPSLREDSR